MVDNCGACLGKTGTITVGFSCSPGLVCGPTIGTLPGDNANCGFLGDVCPLGSVCCGGSKVVVGEQCLLSESCCSGLCVDLQNNNQQCGNCTTNCQATYGVSGACIGGSCFNTSSDPHHCGLFPAPFLDCTLNVGGADKCCSSTCVNFKTSMCPRSPIPSSLIPSLRAVISHHHILSLIHCAHCLDAQHCGSCAACPVGDNCVNGVCTPTTQSASDCGPSHAVTTIID